MSYLWIAATSLHVLAAVTWIGGMLFLSLVLAPLLRSRHSTSEAVALFRSAARRFRLVVWMAIAVLLTTGPFLLAQRNIALMYPSAWPRVVVIKLGLVAILLVLTVSHDVFFGPKVSKVTPVPVSARTLWQQMLVISARWLPRLSLLIALGIVVAAVILART